MNEKLYTALFAVCESENTIYSKKPLTGVFHDNGNLVASDSAILAVVNTVFPESLNGKIYNLSGAEIEYKYPSYRCLIPANTIKLDLEIEDLKKIVRNVPLKKEKFSNYLEIGKATIELTRIKKMLSIFRSIKEAPEVFQKETKHLGVLTLFESKIAKVLIISTPKLPDELKDHLYTFEDAIKYEKIKTKKWFESVV